MRLAFILLLSGVVVLGYAAGIPPYGDEALFMARYMAMSAGQTQEYWSLRESMLSPKYQLQDYGGTLLVLAAAVFWLARVGVRQLKSPKSRLALFGLAFAAPLSSAGAYVFDLFQGASRGEFPHWADSMGIPLFAVPLILLVLLAWSGLHLLFLRGVYQPVLLGQAMSRQSNWWLLAEMALIAVFIILAVLAGQYWYAVTGAVWGYFYTSLAASRCASAADDSAARYIGASNH